MSIDDEARRVFNQDQSLEELRTTLRENLPLVVALMGHDAALPINNPALISTAKACATMVAIPLLPPEATKS